MTTLPNDGASVFSSITQPKRGRENTPSPSGNRFRGFGFLQKAARVALSCFIWVLVWCNLWPLNSLIPTFPQRSWDPSILKVDYPLPTNPGRQALEEFGCFGNPRVFFYHWYIDKHDLFLIAQVSWGFPSDGFFSPIVGVWFTVAPFSPCSHRWNVRCLRNQQRHGTWRRQQRGERKLCRTSGGDEAVNSPEPPGLAPEEWKVWNGQTSFVSKRNKTVFDATCSDLFELRVLFIFECGTSFYSRGAWFE